jgi:glyoxylase-like metal-dependent hydrolase (beta-lactamase superfamily II)
MTGAGNKTYLVASEGEAVLIDAGVGHPDHLAALRRALADSGSSLRMVLLTHGHPDHAAGVPALASAYPEATFAKYLVPGDGPGPAAGWRSLSDGQQIPVGGTVLSVIHTPGHSPDHVAFWQAAPRALFAGDLVIAGSSVTIDAGRGGGLKAYLRSLERILELEPNRLFPAHGPVVDAADGVDPAALVRSYLEHRRTRERQVVAAIEAGHRTVEAIAESIYDGLNPRLMPAARENVRAHLEKLAADGIAADRGGWRIL